MSNQSVGTRSKRSNERQHSSYSEGGLGNVYYGGGIAIQCQFCPGQAFRRSRLRARDLQDLFVMRYPVRCLRCGQRQTVSFAIASVSVPSHIKQRRHRRSVEKFPVGGFPVPSEKFGSSAEPDRADTAKQDNHLAS